MTGKAYSGHTRTNSEPFDFYKTPIKATLALLEREEFEGMIWEPASGDGAISTLLEAKYGKENVMSSDIQTADHVHGRKGVDFLKCNIPYPEVKCIITNPPYKLAQEFVEHALKHASRKVAMLLPLSFLESQRRYKLHKWAPLKAVYVFSRRIRCLKKSDPKELSKVKGTVFAWFVWDHYNQEDPTIGWISPEEVD